VTESIFSALTHHLIIQQLQDHGLLNIHGFTPLGPEWESIDVLVSHSEWRSLPNLMRGTYGQALLSEFFGVDLHVMQQWIESKGYPAAPQGHDLVLDVDNAGQLRLIGYSSDPPTKVEDLMHSEIGRMLVRSELTEDSMRRWRRSSHAQEVVQALVAARAAKQDQSCRNGCFEMLRCAMGRVVAPPEAA